MKTLLLDLGTHTGWALFQEAAHLESGTLHLASEEELEIQRREGKDRTLDIRFARFYDFLVWHLQEGVTRIVFEDVGFVSTRMQTQLWASLRSAIWAAALPYPGVAIFGLPVTTLKHFATGNGHVQKLEMAQALADLLPASYALEGELVRKADGTFADDNEVDAIWLARYTQAVDRGERTFLGVYQRRLLEASDRRKRRKQRKQKAKAKQAATAAAAKAKRRALKAAIRSLGRCCGVFRSQDGRRAVCPKCGSKASIPKTAVPADLVLHSEDSPGFTPNSIWNVSSVPQPALAECPSHIKN